LYYIFLYSFLSSIFLAFAGFPFYKNEKYYKSSPLLLIIFGSISLSVLALLINFFIPLNPKINTFIFFIILIFGFFYILKKKIVLKFFYTCLLIATLSTLIVTLDNINRPDANLYHLPYTKILNDHKIIFGVSNLHFRFGHTSILQYLNAIFNNLIFNENGIILPSALIFSAIVLFFYYEIKKNYFNNKIYTFYIFLALSYILYGYNRYSEFGNDVTGHLIFLLTSSFFLKKNLGNTIRPEEVSKILILSIFCFTLKPTLLFILLLPLYYYCSSNRKGLFINSINFFSLFFLTLWFAKNIIISGCLIYPIEITCFDQLRWFSSDLNFDFSPKIQALDNEAWTKGWPDYRGEAIKQQDYIKNFMWFKTWFLGHGILILKKLLIFTIFSYIFFLILKKFINKGKKFYKPHLLEIKKKILFLSLVSFCGILIWFFRFPIFRYGSAYLVVFLISIFSLLAFKINLENINKKLFHKYLKFSLILFFTLFTLKHLLRIYKNYDTNYINYPWPKFHSSRQIDGVLEVIPIKIKEEILYYLLLSEDGCGYTISPCAIRELKELSFFTKNNYKFYNLKK
jgi:hypothetical protein